MTLASTGICAVHTVPQLMPAGSEATVPLPLFVTVSGQWVRLNTAVTVDAPPTVSAQVPVPLQALPLQPAKAEPTAGVAVSVIVLPNGRVTAQVVPQEMPTGDEFTVKAKGVSDDDDVRLPLYQSVYEQLAVDLPFYPYVETTNGFVLSPDLHGGEVYYDGILRFDLLWTTK